MRLGSLWIALVVALAVQAASAEPAVQSTEIPIETVDGKLVCNPSGAFSQIPGHRDLFVGRGAGIGSLDYCHTGIAPGASAFLALFRMDWAASRLIFDHYLLQPPLTTPDGSKIHNAYDPSAAMFRDRIWVAFECTVPGAVSACVAPLTPDFSQLDLSRLTVVVEGTLGPFGPNKQIVSLLSASSPTLFEYKDHLYLYWIVDAFDNANPANPLVSRGMELEPDSSGRLWGLGAKGRSVVANDPALTTLVADVDRNDPTADHVAAIASVAVSGDRIIAILSVGGTAGRHVCRSTHDDSTGCWRPVLSIAERPIGDNIFGQSGRHPFRGETLLPSNIIEYPRLVTDPRGQVYLSGLFAPLVGGPMPHRLAPMPGKTRMYPFDLRAAVAQDRQ